MTGQFDFIRDRFTRKAAENMQNMSAQLEKQNLKIINAGLPIDVLDVQRGDYVYTHQGWILVDSVRHSTADIEHPTFWGCYVTGKYIGSDSSACVSYNKNSNPAFEAIRAIRQI